MFDTKNRKNEGTRKCDLYSGNGKTDGNFRGKAQSGSDSVKDCESSLAKRIILPHHFASLF